MDPNRRAVLIAGLAAAAGSVGGRAVAVDDGGKRGRSARAAPPVDGSWRFDAEARAAAAEDFGHIVRRRPEGVLHPRSAQDVATAIRWADETGRNIAPQGQRHSVYGRAQASDGIVIDMAPLNTVHAVRDDRVVVDAGAKWSAALAATLPRGLTPPVLTEYLELSVGGTLVVGGVGGTTSRYGMQCNNVLELDVVTGKGETVTCSPSRNSELFETVLAGLGQVGVIIRATVKLVPAPANVRRYVLGYRDLRTLLSDTRLLAAEDRFDAVQGSIVPAPDGWAFKLDAARYVSGEGSPNDDELLAGLSNNPAATELSTLSYFDYVTRFGALEKLLRSNGQWLHPHPWLTTFVGASKIEAVASDELDKLAPPDLGRFGVVALSAFRRPAVTTALQRLPDEATVYAFNLIRIPPTDSAAEADRLIAANRRTYERVRAAGGTLYPVSALPMSRDDWRSHFGPTWTRFRDAKQTFDPRNVLTPGYEVF
jgi:cytokinin dehydrogenase